MWFTFGNVITSEGSLDEHGQRFHWLALSRLSSYKKISTSVLLDGNALNQAARESGYNKSVRAYRGPVR